MPNAYLAKNPAVTAYQTDAVYIVRFNAANTGPATLQFEIANNVLLAAAPIVTMAAAALTGGEIGAGATHSLTYDGTNFVLGASVPVIAPGSVGGAQIQGAGNQNLIPDSGFQFGTVYWTVAAPLAIQTGGGVGGGNSLFAAGTGAALADVLAYSAPIPVTPGAAYILSAWIDARQVTSLTQPAWLLMSTDRTTTYGSVSAVAGEYERVQASITIPAGVTEVIAVFSTEGCTVASGSNLATSAPQLEAAPAATSSTPSQASAYQPNVADNVSGYLKAGAAQVDLNTGLALNKSNVAAKNSPGVDANGNVATAGLAQNAVNRGATAAWSGSAVFGPTLFGAWASPTAPALVAGAAAINGWTTWNNNQVWEIQVAAGQSAVVKMALPTPHFAINGSGVVIALVVADNLPAGLGFVQHNTSPAWGKNFYYGAEPAGMNGATYANEGAMPSIPIGQAYDLTVPASTSASYPTDQVEFGIVAPAGSQCTVYILRVSSESAPASFAFQEWFEALSLAVTVNNPADLIPLHFFLSGNFTSFNDNDSFLAQVVDDQGNVIVEPQSVISSGINATNGTFNAAPSLGLPAANAGARTYTLLVQLDNGSGSNALSGTLTAAKAWLWDQMR